MRRIIASLLALALAPAAVAASDTATQSVTVTVAEINEISVSAASLTLTINSVSSGAPADATDSSSSVSWTTNETGQKVTVQTDLATPKYTLKVAPTVTSGAATGSAQLTLTTTAQDMVTGITKESGAATLGYTASATLSAGAGSDVHTVTYTLVDMGL